VGRTEGSGDGGKEPGKSTRQRTMFFLRVGGKHGTISANRGSLVTRTFVCNLSAGQRA